MRGDPKLAIFCVLGFWKWGGFHTAACRGGMGARLLSKKWPGVQGERAFPSFDIIVLHCNVCCIIETDLTLQGTQQGHR
jgi:hypothetical protein